MSDYFGREGEYHRTNVNLHSKDVEWLKRAYGNGWTAVVRDIVHRSIKLRQNARGNTAQYYDALNKILDDLPFKETP